MAEPLLDLDRELGRRLEPAERDAAREKLLVELETIPPGHWEPPLEEPPPGHLGLLIIEGLMVREVRVAGAASVELLNSGDLLRPWLEDAASFVSATWQCLVTVRLAVLTPAIASSLGAWPGLVEALLDRAIRRSRSMAVHAAVPGQRRIEDRILTVFWHLAERWGERCGDGVRVPLGLTHGTIAHLVSARRPSVTTALGELADQELLVRLDADEWLLRGEPPGAGGAEPR